MKKKKLGFIFNICTMCLAISAIAIGVYSLKQAQLNISGNLGFTMHNCMVAVEGVVKNVAVMDENGGSASMENIDVKKTIMGADSSTSNTLKLQDLYFCEFNDTNNPGTLKIYDLIFELTFTNVCDYDIKAEISKPSIDSSNISVYDYNTDSSKYASYTDFGSGTFATYIKAKGNIIVRFALHLNNSTAINNLVAFNMAFNFSEFNKSMLEIKKSATLTSSSGSDYAFVNAYPYYIEYGTKLVNGTETPITWHIIAKADSNNQMTNFSASSDLNNGKLKTTEKYFFISRDNLTNVDISYQNDYFKYSDSEAYLSVTNGKDIQDVKANDYANSVIRKFLNGETVYGKQVTMFNSGTYTKYNATSSISGSVYSKPSEVSDNFYKTYNLNNSIYNLITPRSLKELYTKMSNTSTVTDISQPTNINNADFTTTNDRFWLLSYNEVVTILTGTDYRKINTGPYWRLRSPNNNYGGVSVVVSTTGGYIVDSSTYQIYYNFGVRPAFML